MGTSYTLRRCTMPPIRTSRLSFFEDPKCTHKIKRATEEQPAPGWPSARLQIVEVPVPLVQKLVVKSLAADGCF